jgi:PDZ domain
MLVNRSGNVVRCAASGYGAAGAAMAYQMVDSCVEDMKRIGYVDLPKATAGFNIEWGPEPHPLPYRLKDVVSPAKEAGLRDGDILLELDGRKIEEPFTAYRIASTKVPGDVMRIKVDRDGKVVEAAVTLRAR